MNTDTPILLYDGDCGLCCGAVKFILRHERAPVLRFASLDSAFARTAFARPDAPELPADTMVVITGRQFLFRSDAALACAAHLRAPWCWLRFASLLPRGLRDRAYTVIAARRRRLIHRDPSCLLPTPATAARFIH